MPFKLNAGRLEVFLKLMTACAGLRDYDPLLALLAQRTHSLIEFERLSILLCDDDHRILRAVVIEGQVSRDVLPDQIPLSEMDLILGTLINGVASTDAAGICAPMVSAGRLTGVICFTARGEAYSSDKVKLVQYLADCLAGTFDRLAQGSNGKVPATPSTANSKRGATTAASHAVSLHMSYLAQHDVLTDLPNRWLLNERLGRALKLSRRYGRRLAVLFLDLDRFKEINDTMGHAVGDQVLRQVSDRLVKCVRSSDTVSRIGGDEFVILLSELKNEMDVTICATKITAAVTTPLKIGDHDIQLTLSIGIGIYPGDGEDADALLRSADVAMYHAKAEGHGNCHFFNKDMDEISRERQTREQLPGPPSPPKLRAVRM